MALRIISQGRSQLHALQQFKLRHAALSTSLHPLFNPFNKETMRQGYLREIGLRAAAEESVPTEPEPEAIPDAVADNPFLNLGVDDRLLVSFKLTTSWRRHAYTLLVISMFTNFPFLCYFSAEWLAIMWNRRPHRCPTSCYT